MGRLYVLEKSIKPSIVTSTKDIPIVEILVSAGGIDSLTELISYIPKSLEISFLINCYHDDLNLDHLSDLISRYTDKQVKTIENLMNVESGIIYIMPPNKNITIKNSKFILNGSDLLPNENLTLNLYLANKNHNFILVILSGYGRIEINTLSLLKYSGDVIIVQDPSEKKYTTIICNAINSGYVDYVLPIHAIPNQIYNLFFGGNKKLAHHSSHIVHVPDKSKQLEFHQLINEFNTYKIELEIQKEESSEARSNLEKLYSNYEELYEFSPTPLFTFDEHGLVVAMNQKASDLLGFSTEFIINRNFSRYITPDSQSNFMQHIKKVITEEIPHSCEIKLLNHHRSFNMVQIYSKTLNNIKIKNSKLILSFIMDVPRYQQSEKPFLRYQKQIAAVDKINSLNELSCNILNALNNPLCVINNYLHGAINRIKSDDFSNQEIINSLEGAVEQAKRISNIILSYKNLISIGKLNFEKVSIAELINHSISFIREESFEYPLHIDVIEPKLLPFVCVDKVYIEQVVINLLRNAVDGMRDEKIEEPKIKIEVNPLNDHNVEISIIDNGIGIDPNHIYKLFNPNYSTKKYGIGLGLTFCHFIIDGHGGDIMIEQNIPQGTCVKFTLPIFIDSQ